MSSFSIVDMLLLVRRRRRQFLVISDSCTRDERRIVLHIDDEYGMCSVNADVECIVIQTRTHTVPSTCRNSMIADPATRYCGMTQAYMSDACWGWTYCARNGVAAYG